MRIVVLDGYTLNPGDNPWDPVARLGDLVVHERTAAAETVERAGGAAIILTNKAPLTAAMLERLPDLRFISVLATGFNIVDVRAARARGIPVSNVPEYSTHSVAQYVFAVLLTLCHHPAEHSRAVMEGQWQRSADFCFWKTPLIELAGRKMGIVGFGRIGRRVGEIAHALGMEVLAASPRQVDEPGYRPFAWRTVEQVFAEADVVTLHCPQNERTAGMVSRSLLATMKSTAFLINASRGGLVREADLAAALNQGLLAGAAVDVVSAEPMQADNPLLGARNLLITPHIAWATQAARRRLMATTAENIAAFQAGQPIHVVN